MVTSRFTYRPARSTPPKFCANPRAVGLTRTSAASNLDSCADRNIVVSEPSKRSFFILDPLIVPSCGLTYYRAFSVETWIAPIGLHLGGTIRRVGIKGRKEG